MTNTFLIGDTHFGHRNSWERFKRADGSPLRPFSSTEEMDETMIANWNRTVKPNDRVWHLGDVVIPRKSLQLLSRLNGRKALVRGNHDIFKDEDYACFFDKIVGSHKMSTYILTHIPIHPDSLSRWSTGNIHGHLHDKRVRLKSDKGWRKVDERYINVSVERTNFTPISFDEIELLRPPTVYDLLKVDESTESGPG